MILYQLYQWTVSVIQQSQSQGSGTGSLIWKTKIKPLGRTSNMAGPFILDKKKKTWHPQTSGFCLQWEGVQLAFIQYSGIYRPQFWMAGNMIPWWILHDNSSNTDWRRHGSHSPQQWYEYQQFNHILFNFTSPVICLWCRENHHHKTCTKEKWETRCLNCAGEHCAASKIGSVYSPYMTLLTKQSPPSRLLAGKPPITNPQPVP